MVLLSQIDDTHAPLAQQAQELVATDPRADLLCGIRIRIRCLVLVSGLILVVRAQRQQTPQPITLQTIESFLAHKPTISRTRVG